MALINCKECNKEISSEAQTCPHCGVKNAPQINLKAKAKTSEIIVGAIIVLAGIGWLLPSNTPSTAESAAASTAEAQPQAQPAAPRAVMTATAQELFDSYEANEVATDEKLKGYVVRVTGKVDSIDKDFTDSISVKLRTRNQFMPVHIPIADQEKSKAIALKRGDKTSFDCESFSRIIGTPMGKDCQFSQ